MKTTIIAVAAAIAFVMVSGCGGGGDDGAGAPGGPAAAKGEFDFSKPYLTDAKVENLIRLLDEKPEELEKFGKGWTPVTASGAMAKVNEFARKYGFEDYQDYANTIVRVTMGMSGVAMEKAQAETEDLPPEAKALMGQMGAFGQKVSEADRKVIEKYWDQLEEIGQNREPDGEEEGE